ncbi:hypothetical protein [Rothia sp. P5766]|uniref:hypothetical protein n=1 Tax=Rothia sp. P5766 TaxID=3402656 RepID=UPI003AE43934
MAYIEFFVQGATSPVRFEADAEVVFAWESAIRKFPKSASDWVEIRVGKSVFFRIPATSPFACDYGVLSDAEPFKAVRLADLYELLSEQWQAGKVLLNDEYEPVTRIYVAGIREFDEYIDFAFERRQIERW